jgi:hypothetical protein
MKRRLAMGDVPGTPDEKWIKEQVTLAPDDTLRGLVDIVNGASGAELGITLFVHGIVVSGRLVSGEMYFDGVASSIRDAYQTENADALAEYFGFYAEEYRKLYAPADDASDDQSDEDASSEPHTAFVHLKDAKFWHSGGASVQQGAYWRGRLSSVDGYYLGTLSVQES